MRSTRSDSGRTPAAGALVAVDEVGRAGIRQWRHTIHGSQISARHSVNSRSLGDDPGQRLKLRFQTMGTNLDEVVMPADVTKTSVPVAITTPSCPIPRQPGRHHVHSR